MIYFYSNEHEPIHVHGKHAGRESRAEIILENGRIVGVVISDIPGKRPLEGRKMKDFEAFINARAEEIVRRWVDFFCEQRSQQAGNHHPENQMKTRAQYLEVTEAKFLSDYKLLLTFSDGAVRVVDFGPFLEKARNPDTTDYRDVKKFKSFRIHYGDLVWGDYQMIFPIMDLYHGTILKGGEITSTQMVLSETAASAANSRRKLKPVSYKAAKQKKNFAE